jgi:hypothetical protein
MENLQNFVGKRQELKTILKMYTKVNELMTSGEEIEYMAVQEVLTPDCLALTNKRIIIYRVKNFGITHEFQDYIWRDVSDCHMKEGLLGAEFKIISVNGQESTIECLPKIQARQIYRIAQEKEEEQREIRRQRELEEKRAGASNVSLNSTTPNQNSDNDIKKDDPLESLKKLKALLENELITQQEYDAKKAEILARL